MKKPQDLLYDPNTHTRTRMHTCTYTHSLFSGLGMQCLMCTQMTWDIFQRQILAVWVWSVV